MEKIFYWILESNFGDLLNIYTVPKMLNTRVKWASPDNAEFMCIGSLLSTIILKHSVFNLIKRLFKPIKILGIGSIDGVHQIAYQNIPRCNWLCVRGKLTKKILQDNFKQNMDNCAVGDLGILISDYFDYKAIQKQYDFGIIFHHSENALNYKINTNNKSSLIIDVSNDVETVLKQIASCKCILSSSLHGLIVADSFNIPNKWICASSELIDAQKFKYLDYYSSLDIYDNIVSNFSDLILDENLFNDISNEFQTRIAKIEELKNNLRYIIKNYKNIKSYGFSFVEGISNIIFMFRRNIKNLLKKKQ